MSKKLVFMTFSIGDELENNVFLEILKLEESKLRIVPDVVSSSLYVVFRRFFRNHLVAHCPI